MWSNTICLLVLAAKLIANSINKFNLILSVLIILYLLSIFVVRNYKFITFNIISKACIASY